jgi:predicted nucleotidyltransferase
LVDFASQLLLDPCWIMVGCNLGELQSDYSLTIVRNKSTIVRNMRTGKKQPIDWLLPKVRQKVLALLFITSDKRWYLRQIVRHTGFALGSVRRELDGLAETEIITRIRDGNRVYYQTNPECPLFPELASLLRKTAGLADVLRTALEPLAGQIKLAFVYGSQAAGQATASSDVDLLIVGNPDEISLHKVISEAEEKLGRSVNYSLLSSSEFAKRRKEAGSFLSRVLKSEKIVIAGDADDV